MVTLPCFAKPYTFFLSFDGVYQSDSPWCIHCPIANNMDERFLLMAEQGNSILVRKLLKAKVVDINAKDGMRMTALAKACKGT